MKSDYGQNSKSVHKLVWITLFGKRIQVLNVIKLQEKSHKNNK